MEHDDRRFLQVFNRLEQHIEDRYGVPVRIRDVPDPFTGDLDGAEIHVDFAQDPQTALFIIIHLFGHTVQWNRSARARHLSTLLVGDTRQDDIDAATMAELRTFEEDACRYSLQLLHDVGVTDLDQWLSDYAACDYAYLVDFYETGTSKPFLSFWKPDQPLLTPLPIPTFEPRRWTGRWEGIVV